MQYKIYKFVPYVILVPAAIIGVRAVMTTQHNVSVSDIPSVSIIQASVVSVPLAESISEDAWTAFRMSDDQSLETGSEGFRLAGTFFLMSNADAGDRRRLAIIDDVTNNKQHIVSEGQSFHEYEVLRIYKDKLIMRKDAQEVVLDLSFAGVKGEDANSGGQREGNPVETEYPSSRYGTQIGEHRWKLRKDALNGYYRELLDNPERIAALYMSLNADLVDGRVAGYRLKPEGENSFFDAVGLIEGDVIRKVNSMKMTSQDRAEYFISEFMQDRLGAVVLDIERDGKNEQMIYLLR